MILISKLLTEEEARSRIKKIPNAEEKRVDTLLLNLGFNAVDFNAKICNEKGQDIGEIDCLFVFENHLLIVETTKESDLETDNIVAWFLKWSEESNLKRIRLKYNLAPKSPHRLFFWLSKERPEQFSANLQPILKDQHNKLVFLDELERYESNFNVVGAWEKNNFLNFLGIKRKQAQYTPIPAILFYVSDKPAFAFSLSAKQLLEISFISRRYKNEVGFQRAIDKKKVDNIKRAIEKKEILAFPNSILINSLSTLLPNKLPPQECPANVTISLPLDYSSCKIIDGQHRMLGFSKVNKEIAESYNLPIVAFEGLSNKEEIDTFVVINSEQKRVDANLVLLLQSDSDWPLNSKFYWQKIAVDVVKKLDKDSYLAGKIYMGYADQERSDTWVTLATLVRAMIQNRFIGKKPLFQNTSNDIETPYKNIREIFGKMKQCDFPYFSKGSDRFFLTNRGLRILFRFILLFHRNKAIKNIVIPLDQALTSLAKIININVRKQLESYYGEGGAKKAVEFLSKLLKEKYGDFKNFQFDLRKV